MSHRSKGIAIISLEVRDGRNEYYVNYMQTQNTILLKKELEKMLANDAFMSDILPVKY